MRQDMIGFELLYLIEEVEAMAVIRVDDGGGRVGALDMDGEPAAGLPTKKVEAIA